MESSIQCSKSQHHVFNPDQQHLFRPLATIPLKPQHKKVLKSFDFMTVRDVFGYSKVTLALVLHIPEDECKSILRTISENLKKEPEVLDLMDVLQEEFKDDKIQKIGTSCPDLDLKLNGGLPVGNLIEIYGEAASGKSQFCFQLCLNVQLSSKHRGLKGEALYIDSEGSFRPERLVEMAEAYHKKYKKDQEFNQQKYLDKIHYVRCHTPEDLKILILHQLDSFLDSHQAVRLVILDSISYQLRYGFDSSDTGDFTQDYEERTRLIQLMSQKLRFVAVQKSICVVIANQVTCNLDTRQVVPALGKVWSHTCSTKILLERLLDEDKRCATIVKSRLTGRYKTDFRITKDGISSF